MLRYKEITSQVILVLKSRNDKLGRNFKHVIGFTSAGAGCCFFALGWETRALLSSACRPLHHHLRPENLRLKTSFPAQEKCRIQTVFCLPGTCICCCVWAHFTTCEETSTLFFDYIILFKLEILCVLLDLLHGISFSQEALPRKQKQDLKNYLKWRWLTALLRWVKEKPSCLFKRAIWILATRPVEEIRELWILEIAQCSFHFLFLLGMSY